MRQMSFSKTIPQMRDRTKTVTRRVGTWNDLQPGTRLMAVEKAQGLAKGEKVRRIGAIEVTHVRREMLFEVTMADIAREGFPDMGRQEFYQLFDSDDGDLVVNRIQFVHLSGIGGDDE